MSMFRTLAVYHDGLFHSAAMNMAIDEALLERAAGPCIRFYRWNSPALSFGYFGRFADVAAYARERDLVRRWTGGGIVFHGDDLTYSIVIPTSDPAFGESSASIYEKVHAALRDSLATTGTTVAGLCERRTDDAALTERRYSECFASPVRADVMLNGRKVAGASQRRTRHGLLQQGSIQNVTVTAAFAEQLAKELADAIQYVELETELVERALDIAEQKYATRAWLERC
jgi:lipoyl(octanoyl) transferase